MFALFNQVSADHMFPVSSGLTQGPMLNQELNPLTKAHVNSPFKVHSCKVNMMYSRCCVQTHTPLLMFIIFTMACSTFCHLQNQPYLMHKRENPQETFGGGQVPTSFGLIVVLGLGYVCLCQPVATTVPPPDRMRSRAGV